MSTKISFLVPRQYLAKLLDVYIYLEQVMRQSVTVPFWEPLKI